MWWEAPTRWDVYLDTERAIVRRRDRSNLRVTWNHLGVVPRDRLADVLRGPEATRRRPTGSLSVFLGSSLCRFETLHQVDRLWRASDLVALARSRIEHRIREDGSSLRLATEAIWDSSAIACAIGARAYADIESTAASCGLTLTSVRPWLGEVFDAMKQQLKDARAVALHEADSVTLATARDGAPSIQTLPARNDASSNECLRLLATNSAIALASVQRFRLSLVPPNGPRMRHAFSDLVVPVSA